MRRDSGGDTRPDKGRLTAAGQATEYGGGAGPFEYMDDVGLMTAVAAIVFDEGYDRSGLNRSVFSRLTAAGSPLRTIVSILGRRGRLRRHQA